MSLRSVSRVAIEYYSFDPGAKFCRELARQLSAGNIRRTNPKCEISTKVFSTPTVPSVNVTFDDGSSQLFQGSSQVTAGKIISEIETAVKIIDTDKWKPWESVSSWKDWGKPKSTPLDHLVKK